MIAADRDQRIDWVWTFGRAEQTGCVRFDRGERLADRERIAGNVAGVGELQRGERLHVVLGVILRANRTRRLPNGGWAETSARPEADTTIERHTKNGNIALRNVT